MREKFSIKTKNPKETKLTNHVITYVPKFIPYVDFVKLSSDNSFDFQIYLELLSLKHVGIFLYFCHDL